MKLLAAFISVLLVGWTVAVLPDHLGYDQVTLSPWYQTCSVGTTGTACVVFNPQSGASQIYVVSSIQTAQISAYSLILCSNDSPNSPAVAVTQICSGATGSNLQTAPYGAITGSVMTSPRLIPATLTLTGSSGADIFSFTNVFKYETKNGQPGVRDAMEVNGDKDGSGYKYNPTYVETFTPTNGYILLSRLPTAKNLLNRINSYNLVVVHPGTSGVVMEGDMVQVNLATCLTKLVKINGNPANTDDVLALSPYCVVPSTAILGKISEMSYGANRAYVGMGMIKKAVPTSWRQA